MMFKLITETLFIKFKNYPNIKSIKVLIVKYIENENIVKKQIK